MRRDVGEPAVNAGIVIASVDTGRAGRAWRRLTQRQWRQALSA
ncbi:hypothetical protein [Nocardia fluminea]